MPHSAAAARDEEELHISFMLSVPYSTVTASRAALCPIYAGASSTLVTSQCKRAQHCPSHGVVPALFAGSGGSRLAARPPLTVRKRLRTAAAGTGTWCARLFEIGRAHV